MAAKNIARKGNGKANAWRGIPDADRPGVRMFMGIRNWKGGPQAIYAEMKRRIAKDAEARQRVEREREDKERLRRRAAARETVEQALRKMSHVRDFLEQIEHERTNDIDAETYATFARATLVEAGRELEQSLSDLGVYPGVSQEPVLEGHFGEMYPMPGTAKRPNGVRETTAS